MRIAIGCDHIVTDIKNEVRDTLISQGHSVVDFGTYDNVRTHYPIYGQRVGHDVASGNADFGICICGTGVGISISAQKVQGTRVALVGDVVSAKEAREKYDANIIAFGGRVSGVGSIMDMLETFMTTDYISTAINDDFINEISKLGAKEKVSFEPFLQKWEEGYYHD